jgi:hypothetical protein
MLGDDADSDLILDMLEGETDVLECAQAVLDVINEDQIMLDGIAAHLEAINERRERIKHSLERRRGLLQRMLEKLGLSSLKLPTATLTIRKGRQRAIVTNETELLETRPELFAWKPVLDKKALKAALENNHDVYGANLSNAADTLSIRRK